MLAAVLAVRANINEKKKNNDVQGVPIERPYSLSFS